METWAILPSIDADINKFKGCVTSINRYVTSLEVNIGSEDDDNASTHPHLSQPTVQSSQPATDKSWVNNNNEPSYFEAKLEIENGTIKSEQNLLDKYMFNPTKPASIKAKSELVALIK